MVKMILIDCKINGMMIGSEMLDLNEGVQIPKEKCLSVDTRLYYAFVGKTYDL